MIRLGQLPVILTIGEKEWKIRTDYRDILVIMQAFNDPELMVEEAYVVMCKILYENWPDMPRELYEEAAKKALWFLDCGQEDEDEIMPVKVMDWEQDESILFPAINQVAGCEVRSVSYIHWWTLWDILWRSGKESFLLCLGSGRKWRRVSAWKSGKENSAEAIRKSVILRHDIRKKNRKKLITGISY